MSLLRRLFSVDYRRAVSAEAAGDFLTAARSYALCGERDKVVQMHVAQSRIEKSLDDRVHSLSTALGFTTAGTGLRADVLHQLGEALVERARAHGVSSSEGQRAMREAAGRFAEGGWHERCGDCWLELDQKEQAAAAYSRAGLVEKVETLLTAQEERQSRQRREESCFKDYELLLQGGQRDEAAAALRTCIEVASRKGEYRRLLAELEGRLLLDNRVTLIVGAARLTLVGGFPLLVGRDSECQLRVRGPTVSRRHARIVRGAGGDFSLEDLGSHNGTLLGGMRIAAPMPLPPSASVGLGDGCSVEFALLGEPATAVRARVQSGLDAGLQLVAGPGPHDLTRLLPDGPPLELSFERGRPLARPREGRLELNAARTGGPVQLIRDDRLALEGQIIRVEG